MKKQELINEIVKIRRVSKCIYLVNRMRIDIREKLPEKFARHWAQTRGIYRALMCYYLTYIPAEGWGVLELDDVICDKINSKSAEIFVLEAQSIIL